LTDICLRQPALASRCVTLKTEKEKKTPTWIVLTVT